MLDASINKTQPTMFVNIGLQNGVLLRTVLDPINGQLTDTRTRYVYFLVRRLSHVLMNLLQILGHTTNKACASPNTTKPRHSGSFLSLMAELYPPKSYAFYATDLREFRLCLEFLC